MPRPAHRLRAAVLQESTPIAIYYGAQRGETLGAFEFAAAAFVERTCPREQPGRLLHHEARRIVA